MTNIKEMTDLEISDRLAELDPMEFTLSAELKTERMTLLWERYLRNIAAAAVGRFVTETRNAYWEDFDEWENEQDLISD